MRCCLALCTWRDLDWELTNALLGLISTKTKHQFLITTYPEDALISRSRSTAASKFLDNPSYGDALIFVDSDMVFDIAGIQLLADDLENGFDICGGGFVVRSRNTPPHPAFRGFPGVVIPFGTDSPPVEIKYPSSGFMGIHRRVLEAISQTMEKCRSGRDMIWPLFLEKVEEGELLSEDWAFVYDARKLGFKAWLDPRIWLKHIGVKAFTIADITTDMDAAYSVVKEEIDDSTGIMDDLATYQGKSKEQVLVELKDSTIGQGLMDDWKKVDTTNPESVKSFYRTTTNYIHRMARFNLSSNYIRRLEKAKTMVGRIADFGGGIGTMCLSLARIGNKVFYVDLPSQHREFAEYRFARHNVSVVALDSLKGVENLDYVVAHDVMEHIHPDELPSIVEAITLSLKPKGILWEISDFGGSNDFPHFSTNDLFIKLAAREGLHLREPAIWVKEGY